MHTYEPTDLDDMTLEEALDAVRAHLLAHPTPATADSVFTVLRHIDLLCHLTARAAGDAQFGLAYDQASAAEQARVEPLSRAAAHLGRATAHYTLILAPAIALSRVGAQTTLQKQLDSIDIHVYFHDALRALSDARTCLTVPHLPSGQAIPAPPPSSQQANRLR
ncbi:hypothetical protein ACM01_15840 [Streptomyces viridochromogenes]|uniref:Uncharacterized protein n=1 Tax=Streptomyces viridochromogenes TaxID=1938 RepID=A0A0J7ZFZ8_STRVR|nr:hypothetical protein [Streptomyces viridochromogenes]KMS74093.1 hypothetical protein ACM01_15840 [Streptomyces viridochromogenes]